MQVTAFLEINEESSTDLFGSNLSSTQVYLFYPSFPHNPDHTLHVTRHMCVTYRHIHDMLSLSVWRNTKDVTCTPNDVTRGKPNKMKTKQGNYQNIITLLSAMFKVVSV